MTVTTPPTLRQLVTRSDDHPALVVPESGASLSYAALQRALDRAAGRLAALGVGEMTAELDDLRITRLLHDGSAAAASAAAENQVAASSMSLRDAQLQVD